MAGGVKATMVKTVGLLEMKLFTTMNTIRIMQIVNQFMTYLKNKLFLLSLIEMKKVYLKNGLKL
jgi:hypothetical protein